MKTRLLLVFIVLTATFALACTSLQALMPGEDDLAPAPPVILAFSANPSKIENGSSVLLRWEVNNADIVFIDNGIGFVDVAGSLEVRPYELTTYNLTASNITGDVGSAVIINVLPFMRVASAVNNQDASSNEAYSSVLPKLDVNESYVFFNQAVMVGADDHFIVLRNNPEARDPTWAELKTFLKSDMTDRHAYITGQYTCGDFAETLHNNAESVGIRAAIVAIELASPASPGVIVNHSLNAFETTDRGIMYIDDTSSSAGYYADKVASVRIGDDYVCVSLFPQKGQLQTWPSMGRILTIDIFQW